MPDADRRGKLPPNQYTFAAADESRIVADVPLLRYPAAAKGVGTVVMEPLPGGRSTERIPEEISTLWKLDSVSRTPAEWALCRVWKHPEVSLVLCGLSTMDQLRENIRIAADAGPESLSRVEHDVVDKAGEVY